MIFQINKSKAGMPMLAKHSFTFYVRNSGMHQADIQLTLNGEYDVKVDGSPYSMHIAAAKRNSQYKIAIESVTRDMQRALESYNNSFVQIARKTKRPFNRSVLEQQIKNLVPQKYTREPFSLPQPTQSEIELDLSKEAEDKFFSVWKKNSAQKKQFVSNNIDKEYSQRLEKWEELKNYHESIQDVLASQANKQFEKEYNKSKKELEQELYGEVNFVYNRLAQIIAQVDSKMPFDITLEVDYQQKSGVIEAVATLPNFLNIPDKKVVPLTTGRISIKDKLKREVEEDRTNTLLGLSYYLAGLFFFTSVNIQYVRLSVKAGISAYYWVEFERGSFAAISFSTITPVKLFFRNLNVIDYTKQFINLIPDPEFQKRVSETIALKSILDNNKNLIILNIKDAELIVKSIDAAEDLKQAVREAKKKGSYNVIADKRYQSVLEELKTD